MLSTQLTLAQLGYKVFPCAGKHPLTKHGCRDATTDETQIEQWSNQWPNANWAIATDGLLVVDIDPLADGVNPRPDDYERALDLAAAPMVITPRNGKHYYFRQPEGMSLGNTVGKLAASVDIQRELARERLAKHAFSPARQSCRKPLKSTQAASAVSLAV